MNWLKTHYFTFPFGLMNALVGAFLLLSAVQFVPQSIQTIELTWVSISWSAIVMIGGMLTLVGMWFKSLPFEYVGKAFLCFAYAFYSLAIIFMTWPQGLVASCFLMSLSVSCGLRMLVLHDIVKIDPQIWRAMSDDKDAK